MKRLKITAAMGAAALGMSGFTASAQAQVDPYLGQLMYFGGTFCPRGWADAAGSILPISSNPALFSLFGTNYGGDGRTTFGLPDLRGRAPISDGTGPGLPNYVIGQTGGSTSFTLTVAQLPSHNHTGTVAASPTLGDTNQPVRNSFAQAPAGQNVYLDGSPAVNNMNADTLRINNTGGGQAVNKLSPFLVARWCVAIQGTFPSRN
ncbi:MAG: tail fiber protein [Pseudomonadota bacterium]